VIKAPLDFGLRPDFTDGPDDRKLAVHCNYKGIEALGLQALKPHEDIAVPLLGGMEKTHDRLAQGIHERDKAVVPSEIGPVVDDVLDLGQVHDTLGRLTEPMVFDLFDFEMAMAGKPRKPSDRIAFLDPKLKPGEFIALFDIQAFPNEAPLA
jgi:hypothetical protein